MNKLISGYLWAWTNYEAGSKSVATVKKYYPDADIFINVDYDGDVENYKNICNNNDYIFSRNSFQLGYCGNFGSVNVGRECWGLKECVEWMDRLYSALLQTNSKYIILLEEDDFVLKPISILDTDFSMAIHPTSPSPVGIFRPNYIPNEFIKFISDNDGNPISDGYAAGGGTIFDRNNMIISWQKSKPLLIENFNYLRSVCKIIGWQDYLMQFVMQLGGFEIIQNRNLCEHWEVKDRWNEFEIVTGMKDINLISKI